MTIIYSFCLIDKLTREIPLTETNIHKVFFISLYLSAKLNEDIIFNENDFCEISGIKNKELAVLEKTFLETVNYRIFISRKDFNSYYKAFIN